MKKSTKEEFIKNSNFIHNNTYDYSKVDYINNKTKVIITCRIHGDFKQTPNNHLKGKSCNFCSVKKRSSNRAYNTDSFIEKASIVHNNFYKYNNVNYKRKLDFVIITCPIHGDFNQRAVHHLSGYGCQCCAIENKGYGRADFVKQAKGKLCTFYTLRCFNENEEFYKIGITKHSIKKRYATTKSMPYSYEIIVEITGEAGEIWDLELKAKRKLKKFNYKPLIDFKGSKTECFNKNILK